MKCLTCGFELIRNKKMKIGNPTYVCIKCNRYYYLGDPNSKFIIKNGIKFYNLNGGKHDI